MKTLFISNLYPSADAPTRGMYNVHVFGAIARHCETRLISPRPWWTRIKQPGKLFTISRENRGGMETTYPTFWTLPRYGVSHNGTALYHSLRGQVKRLRRDFPFDVILAAWAYPDAVAAARLALDFDCPLVVNVLGSDINALAQMSALRPQIVASLRQAHRVISVSGALRERVLELGLPPEQVIVQHNGVDREKFTLQDGAAIRAGLDLPPNRPIILYVGNFVPEKGVDTLVTAIKHLRESGQKDVLLALVGSGSLEPMLHSLVAQHGLQDSVRFCGRKPHDEIPDWMAACDVFCLPSLREGCPNVVLESLSSGRPVVASRVGGVPELLDDTTGLLVPAGQPEAFAKALHTALCRNWNAEALRESTRHNSWELAGDAYYAALESAVNNRK